MIHVYGDFYIESDPSQFRVVTPRGINKKTGDIDWESVSYHTTMEGALKSVRTQLFKENVKDAEIELPEAIERWAKITAELDEIIKHAVGGLG